MHRVVQSRIAADRRARMDWKTMIQAGRPWCAAILLVLAAAGGAPGVDDGDDDPNAVRDPSYVAARQALRGRAVCRRDPASQRRPRDSRDADTHNLLGFAYRNAGDLDRAFRHYHEALRLPA